MADDFAQFRFKRGVMRGMLVGSAPTRYLRECLASIPAGTDTARACQWELDRRQAELKAATIDNPYQLGMFAEEQGS